MFKILFLSLALFFSPIQVQASSTYNQQIDYYCSVYGCNAKTLKYVMWRESRGIATAYNPSGATGLFQFMPRTWNYMNKQSGVNGNIWNPNHQIQVASWAFANGYASHWNM